MRRLTNLDKTRFRFIINSDRTSVPPSDWGSPTMMKKVPRKAGVRHLPPQQRGKDTHRPPTNSAHARREAELRADARRARNRGFEGCMGH